MVFLTNTLAPKVKLRFDLATYSTQLDLTGLPAGSYQVSICDEAGSVVIEDTLPAGRTHQISLLGLAGRSYSVLVRSLRLGEGFVFLNQRLTPRPAVLRA